MKQKSTNRNIQKTGTSTKFELTNGVLPIAMNQYAEMGLSEFEEAVRKEMDENPALEEKDDWDNEGLYSASDEENSGENKSDEEREDIGRDEDYDSGRDDTPHDDDGLDLSDYVGAEPRYAPEFVMVERAANSQTFYESLLEQMNDFDLSEQDQDIMRFLISNLDSNGYMTKEIIDIVYELDFRFYVSTTEEHVEHLLHILQSFDPRGLGARNLQECLLIQVKALPQTTPLRAAAIKALNDYFECFESLDWPRLKRRLKLNDEDFESLQRLFKRLNPKPGNQLNVGIEDQAPTIVPDVFIDITHEGEPAISLNHGRVPELCVSPSYAETIKHYGEQRDKLTKQMEDQLLFVQSKVDAAKTFINLVNLRYLALTSVTEIILEVQREFFLNEDDETLLKTLRMEDVAKRLSIDISTVSRIVKGKFLQTMYGVYPMKFFFMSSFTTEEGVEIMGQHAMLKLKEIVDNEDKTSPYSDDQLAAEMKNAGFPIARRTVAKYRDRLHIPEKRLRKQKK